MAVRVLSPQLFLVVLYMNKIQQLREIDMSDFCGCKGIRSCLICEKLKGVIFAVPEDEQKCAFYTYCPDCNLCWPDSPQPPAESCDLNDPLYLGNILVIPYFLTEDEEFHVVAEIDRIPWVPSQSGRLKQDFGPKVNFKKKKVRKGNFNGFPRFSKTLLQKLHSVPDLSDFRAIELCNLDYDPERGSSIDPHIDDSWVWGERLVTISTLTSTILTLNPASASNSCNCAFTVKNNNYSVDSHNNSGNSKVCSASAEQSDYPSFQRNNCKHFSEAKYTLEKKPFQFNQRTLCDVFRTKNDLNVAIRVMLPPRSLFVLSGCARHNWFHSIRRQDVRGRRLAMTFRELSDEFLGNGKEARVGDELLKITSVFIDECNQIIK